MADEKITENEKDIIRISGELKLINQKLDNHVFHMSAKIDTIFKIVWTCSFMILGLLLKAVYGIMAGQSQKKTLIFERRRRKQTSLDHQYPPKKDLT